MPINLSGPGLNTAESSQLADEPATFNKIDLGDIDLVD